MLVIRELKYVSNVCQLSLTDYPYIDRRIWKFLCKHLKLEALEPTPYRADFL